MKPTIAVIDYGMGNLRSVAKALELVGGRVVVTGSPKEISSAQAAVFPGVGSFGPAVKHVKRYGLTKAIGRVISDDKPFLGLCLGFQLLFSRSEEEGDFKGLDVVAGDVVRFDLPKKGGYKVPHMGWNRVKFANGAGKTMFRGIKDSSYFYFVHSYYGKSEDNRVVSGTTEYGIRFCSAIARGRTWACQFHPEKSGENGLRLLRNFVREVEKCS